ncbi:MAG: relaxase/mobilization nuclease domain-containing protein [Acidobacteriota bacterium]|nr:relaxase/mobilization nuclease domain-containing protein [Acidobacteriota bacterium]
MPYVKPIPGHTRTGGIMRYLEKERRALAHDFQRMSVPVVGDGPSGPEYAPFDWASRMDGTREGLGNDLAWKGKRARTFMHYVLSPSPEDRIDLASLRELAVRWAEENFPDHEVAIVYHDDNERRIPHAHIVVNNTNLDTGRRLQVPNPRDLTSSCQRIAAEMGLSHFAEVAPSPGTRGRLDVRMRRHVDRQEMELRGRGEYSWVADIRARVDVARGIAKSPDDFQSALREMGINVREAASRKGDWVYSLAEAPTRQVTGSRLGASYTKGEVTGWLRSPTRRAPGPVTVRNVREVAAGAIEVKDLSELVALSEAVSVVSRGGFRSLSAMDSAASRMRGMSNREATVARLERARQYCAEHGILPEKSTHQPGRRSAGSPGAHGNHRTGQEHHGGSRLARQQTRRDERPER